MGSAPPVRIVLVDDHEMVIEGLKAMLAAFDSRVTVVGQAVGADRVLSVVGDLDPDIPLAGIALLRADVERDAVWVEPAPGRLDH